MSAAAQVLDSVVPDARLVAANGNEADRAALAGRPDLSPELLYFLARDRASAVRSAVAANSATPPQADQLLHADADIAVRAALASKLAAAAPRLAASTSDKLRHMAQDSLNRLVRDAEVQVRAAIAEAVRDLPDAPRELILALARDVAMPVAEPVLRFSPLLGDADLMALVTQPPADATLSAIARRPHLAESLSDALVATGNAEAITALLANSSARIREATLDQLIGQAAARTEWHAPMVRRPRLSPRAAAQLANIVADTLLRELTARTDLPTATREALAAAVQRRLSPAAAAAPPVPSHAPEPAPDEAMAEARGLALRGELTEALLLEAASRAEVRRTTALLAAACGVPYSLVERAASLRSAKGLVSLCWKAGYGMRAAVAVQALLGRIPPAKLLNAAPGGAFPLAPDEMRWQIDVLTKMGR